MCHCTPRGELIALASEQHRIRVWADFEEHLINAGHLNVPACIGNWYPIADQHNDLVACLVLDAKAAQAESRYLRIRIEASRNLNKRTIILSRFTDEIANLDRLSDKLR